MTSPPPTPPMLDRIREYLGGRGVAFREIAHPPVARAEDYSRVLGTRLEQQAKCLLVRLKWRGRADREYVLVSLPAQKRLDLGVIERLSQGASARLADREQIVAVTGCRFGELPPLGSLIGLRLFMDRDLLAEEEIYFNAGRHDISMTVSPRDIATLEDALVYDAQ